MAENEDGQERSEEPTAKKREEARKKGDVPRSKELAAFVVMLLGSLGCIMIAGNVFEALRGVFRESMILPREVVFDTYWMYRILTDAVQGVFWALGPFMFVLLIATLVTPALIGGWVFSAEALQPKLNKLNPITGLKRMFSAHGLMELLKALIKFVLVGGTGILLLLFFYEPMLNLDREDTQLAIVHGVTIVGWAFFVLSVCLALLVVFDVPFQLFQHTKKLKMTKQEVKDEYKDSEGKPEVKSKIRRTQYEMSQRRMMEAVPQADVVITNPTHFAVALKYDPDTMGAPVVLAKGTDLMAEKIKLIARERGITILEAPPLARSLYYHTKLDREIPEGLYVAVAQVLAYVFQLKNYRRGAGPNPGSVPDVEVPEDLRRDPE